MFLKKLHTLKLVLALAVVAAFAGAAHAAVMVNSNGTGFVGKGDVQLVYSWNNNQLQSNADSVQFRTSIVTEVSWICNRFNPQGTEQFQGRSRTTTTIGLLSVVARLKNQITGFNLLGFDGDLISSTSGDPLNSCPGGGGWSLLTPAGDPVVVDSFVEVSINGLNWFGL